MCSEGCQHGECTEPEVCTCHSGFSGSQCQTVGCPRGSWGPDCGHTCPCQNGGWCDPVTGDCTCAPGFLGDTCTDTCQTGTWGELCNNDCDCDTGEMCHHVTGTCSPCQAGTWGDACLNTCNCNNEVRRGHFGSVIYGSILTIRLDTNVIALGARIKSQILENVLKICLDHILCYVTLLHGNKHM